jgi:hypothetical protein
MKTIKPQYIIIHHSVTPQKPWLEVAPGIDRSHENRGFPKAKSGYYIGYHRLIDLDGVQLMVRDDIEMGSHCSAQGMNFKAIGICLLGNFEKDEPTYEQLEKLRQVLVKLMAKHDIPVENILPHGKVGQTACCGRNLKLALEKMKEEIKNGAKVEVWQEMARRWAFENDVIKKFDESPFTSEQTYWLCEVLRKYNNLK